MRLLHVIHDLSPAGGGPPENLLQLARGYSAIGVDVEVLSLDAPGAEYLARYPFRVHALGPARTTFGYSPAARAWLRQHAADYDGIVIDGLWQYPALAVREACLAVGVPYLVFPHGMLDPWFRSRYPAKHLKKQLFWWLAQYRVLRDAFRVVFTTEAEQELAPTSFWPNRWQSAIAPLGTSRPVGDADEQRQAFLGAFPALKGQRFFLFLSRIHEKKGCDLLLPAFCKVALAQPDLHLVMAGPDESGLRHGLEAIARARGLERRVHWPGMIQNDMKWGAFHAAEAFVLPSHQENFGIAIAEAIACRLPVLISNKINIWHYIVEDGTGFVEDDTDAGTLRLLERWLALSPGEKEAFIARTDASFQKRFSMQRCAARIRDLVEDARGLRNEPPKTAPRLVNQQS